MKLLQFNLGLNRPSAPPSPGALDSVFQIVADSAVDIASLQGLPRSGIRHARGWATHFNQSCEHEGAALFLKGDAGRPEVVPLSRRRPNEDPTRRALITAEYSGVLFVSAYFSWKPAQAMDNARETIAFLNRHPGPAVIAGDFNQTPESATMSLFRAAGFRDVWADLRRDDDGNSFDGDGEPRRIDLILERSDRPLVRDVSIVEESARISDHRGVLAEVDI